MDPEVWILPVTCLVETVARNSRVSLLGCTQASGQAGGMGLVLSRERGELEFGGKTPPLGQAHAQP